MDTIILKLGHQCNFNCVYCSQEHLINNGREWEGLSPSLFSFLDKHRGKGITIKFYGGEPLLYFDYIKQIIEKYREDFSYMLISNGSLLRKPMVELFNRYKVRFLLSHDGASTKKTKKKDVLKSKRLVGLFQALKHFEFISVISLYNQRIDHLYDFFRDKGFKDTRVNLVWIVNNGTREQRKASLIDLEGYRRGIWTVIARQELLRRGLNCDYKQELSYINYWLKCMLYQQSHTHKCSSCGYFAGMERIVVDRQGYVYDCQNQDEIIGIIDDGEVDKKDKTKLPLDLGCEECPYNNFCEKVCPNMSVQGAELWCSLYRITFEEITKYLLQKKEELNGKV